MIAPLSEPAQAALDRARAEIDSIDEALVSLLAERVAAVRQLAHDKRQLGLGAVDASREEAVVERWAARGLVLGMPKGFAESVARAVLASSRAEVRAIVEGTELYEPSTRG